MWHTPSTKMLYQTPALKCPTLNSWGHLCASRATSNCARFGGNNLVKQSNQVADINSLVSNVVIQFLQQYDSLGKHKITDMTKCLPPIILIMKTAVKDNNRVQTWFNGEDCVSKLTTVLVSSKHVSRQQPRRRSICIIPACPTQQWNQQFSTL